MKEDENNRSFFELGYRCANSFLRVFFALFVDFLFLTNFFNFIRISLFMCDVIRFGFKLLYKS